LDNQQVRSKEEEDLCQRLKKEEEKVQKLELELQRTLTETSKLDNQQVWSK
jgi:hypothetical protein